MQSTTDIDLRSRSLPGGSLINAMYDRELMQLSDRGGASGIVGDRWSDVTASHLRQHPNDMKAVGELVSNVVYHTVIRLDDVPAIAATASRHNLQNPDFLLIGEQDGESILQAADAKFSIEMAKSRQVSAQSLRALLDLGPLITRHLPMPVNELRAVDGVFLSPDYSFTRRLLQRTRGVRRVGVRDEEIRLVPIQPVPFIEPIEQARLIPLLAARDDIDRDYQESVLLSLYYLRLACASVGCWFDQTAPLLNGRERPSLDVEAVAAALTPALIDSSGAWASVLAFNGLAEDVRRQRSAVDQVTSVPLNNRELRDRILQAAERSQVVPPGVGLTRRRIGSWFREQLRIEFGSLEPPVVEFSLVLTQLASYSRSLRPQLEGVTSAVIADLVANSPRRSLQVPEIGS